MLCGLQGSSGGGPRSLCEQDLVGTIGFRLLNLDATEIWSWRILRCGGAVMYLVEYPASPLASVPEAPLLPSCDIKSISRNYQTSPGDKISPSENHWFREP